MNFSDIQSKSKDIFQKSIGFFRPKNKNPESNKYPFVLIDSYSIFGEKNRYEKFFLVGDNWNENPHLPIAIVIGCNNWKFGFISDYLKGYRLAFLGRKITGLRAIKRILMLDNMPSNIFIWSYTEKKIFSIFNFLLRKFNCKISRIEDGFIRSSELGATHSTPYSLVFDDKGLYFNSYKESNLEFLLNNYDIDSSSSILDKSKELMELIVNEGLSKYNPPVTPKFFKVKTKKIVAVLGQIDSDSSIRYGNPDNWDSDKLIYQAYIENPDAEIIYRPHPEVYKKFQKSKLNIDLKKFLNLKIVNPKESLSDFLKNIDHIYTITSLSGFEALIRGKKVTVVGAPFYAGWGLTDDRCTKNLNRRKRRRNLEELFCISYLIYPKYLANLDNSYQGLFAACLRIKADQKIGEYNFYKNQFNSENYSELFKTSYSVKYLFSSKSITDLKNIEFAIYLGPKYSPMFKSIFVITIYGSLKTNELKREFFSKIRNNLSFKLFYEILSTIYKYDANDIILENILWINKQNINFKIDKIFFEKTNDLIKDSNLRKIQYKEESKPINLNYTENQILDNTIKLLSENKFDQIKNISSLIGDSRIRFSISSSTIFYNQYLFLISEGDYEKAFDLATFMLVNGINNRAIFFDMINYTKLIFNFKTARELSQIIQNVDLYGQNKNAILAEVNTFGSRDIEEIGELNFFYKLARLVILSPRSISLVEDILNVKTYKKFDPKAMYTILESILFLDNEQNLQKAEAFTSISRPDISIKIIQHIFENNKGNPPVNTIIAYTKALSFDNRLDEAIEIIDNAIRKFPVKLVLMEGIRLNVVNNNYLRCKEILEISKENNIQLGDMYYRKTFFGLKELNKAFESFKETPMRINFLKYFKMKYLLDFDDLKNLSTLTIITIFGPGDEIRWASIYENLIKLFPNLSIKVTCNPKLESLFKRSFPSISFFPCDKLRDADFDFSEKLVDENYSKVPGYDLLRIIDNNGVKAIDSSEKVAFITDFLPEFLLDYSSFRGSSYLIENAKRKDEFKKLIPKNNICVGLSWRSSLTTHSRVEHYLTIQELEPLFKIEGITFVNFQYDDCTKELEWVEKRYPNKLINFENLDQYDDIDGVSSLLKCMDLVIAPATTVLELSGALGCPTWMFSNSSELDWRKKNIEGTDVWHESVKIIDVEEKGNKKLLVNELYEKLLSFSSKFDL